MATKKRGFGEWLGESLSKFWRFLRKGCLMPKLDEQTRVCSCGGVMMWERYCGAFVCQDCDEHKGLARCYCGWSRSGGNGREELEEMGEVIEAEDY